MSQLIQNKFEKDKMNFLNKYCDKDKENLVFNKSSTKKSKDGQAVAPFL